MKIWRIEDVGTKDGVKECKFFLYLHFHLALFCIYHFKGLHFGLKQYLLLNLMKLEQLLYKLKIENLLRVVRQLVRDEK